jgi:hypothetical protein
MSVGAKWRCLTALQVRFFQKGDVIVAQGDVSARARALRWTVLDAAVFGPLPLFHASRPQPSDGCYIVLNGTVDVYKRPEREDPDEATDVPSAGSGDGTRPLRDSAGSGDGTAPSRDSAGSIDGTASSRDSTESARAATPTRRRSQIQLQGGSLRRATNFATAAPSLPRRTRGGGGGGCDGGGGSSDGAPGAVGARAVAGAAGPSPSSSRGRQTLLALDPNELGKRVATIDAGES